VLLLPTAISTNRTTARGEGVTWEGTEEDTTTAEEEDTTEATTEDTNVETNVETTTAGGMTGTGEDHQGEETTGSQTRAGEAGHRRLVVGMMITREVSCSRSGILGSSPTDPHCSPTDYRRSRSPPPSRYDSSHSNGRAPIPPRSDAGSARSRGEDDRVPAPRDAPREERNSKGAKGKDKGERSPSPVTADDAADVDAAAMAAMMGFSGFDTTSVSLSGSSCSARDTSSELIFISLSNSTSTYKTISQR
jgi:hypothetical protein